jgi:hypothetical protein
MQLLIRQKFIAGFPRGYPYKAMLVFVGQIFQAMPGTVQDAAALPDTGGQGSIEGMAHRVARPPHEEVQPIAQKAVPKQYWETLDKGLG